MQINWSASDALAGPSGVYTVSIITDTEPLVVWLSNTTLTQATFNSEFGHQYTFIVTATDRVSNTAHMTATTYVLEATKYYYLGGSRVAMRRSAPTGNGEVSYLHSDHLGTVSAVTDDNTQVLARTLNLPFGATRWESGTSPTDYSFTGQKLDASTGLHFYHARYYSSFIGRFVSADTIVPNAANPQAFNRFSYVLNNPLRYTDPSGHYMCSDCDGGGGMPMTYRRWLREVVGAGSYLGDGVVEQLQSMEETFWDYDDYVGVEIVGMVSGDPYEQLREELEKNGVNCLTPRMLSLCPPLNFEFDHELVFEQLVLFYAEAGVEVPQVIILFAKKDEGNTQEGNQSGSGSDKPSIPSVEISKEEMARLAKSVDLSGAAAKIKQAWKSASVTYGQVNQYIINFYENGQHVATIHQVRTLAGELVHMDFKAIIIEGVKYWVR